MSAGPRARRTVGAVLLALSAELGPSAAAVGARQESGTAPEPGASIPAVSGAEPIADERAEALARGLEVVLPEGFHLDLASGLVTSRAPDAATGWVGLADGRLVGPVALRRLATAAERGARSDADAPPDVAPGAVRRADGDPVSGPSPRAGDELVFELDAADPGRGWGWLRVARAGPSGAALEVAWAAPGAERLERSPRRVDVTAVEGGLELAWPHAAPRAGDDSTGWLVWRAVVPAQRGLGARRFELLARVDAPPFVDATPAPEVLYEYRVAPADGSGIAARARGVADGPAGDELVTVERGSVVSLLTGATDGRRADLRVDFANQDGLQLSPGDDAALRLLNGTEESDWMLPDPDDGSYTTPRTFLQVGRSLAVRLAEGVLARVVIESGNGPSPGLRWRVDLDGGRLFPQPPGVPAARFTDEGAVLDFAVQGPAVARPDLKGIVAQPPRALADLPPGTSIVVLREDEYGSQRFVEVLEGEPGAARIVDPVGASARIVRYRFLYRSGAHESPPGEPFRLLLVDRSDEAAVDALVTQAIAELGRPDFEERLRARAVLEEVGARAIDELSEALASDDPEVVGAAREILVGLETAPAEGAPAPAALVLRARAATLGLAPEPPLAELLDARACVRALALLRARSGADAAVERWRALMAESDPDEGVRLTGALTGAMQPEPWRPALERLALSAPSVEGGGAGREAAARLRGALPSARTLADARELLADELTSGGALDPWHELALCTLYFELDLPDVRAGTRDEDPGRVLSRLALALGLLEQHAESGAPVFLEALAELFDDPRASLMARRTFARRRAERVEETRRPRAVVRLASADGAELSERLRELAQEGARDVCIVLPPGVYDWEVGDRSELAVPGLWLVGEGDAGDVHVRGMLAVQDASDVVLVNLTIDGDNRPSLSVTDGGVTLADCRLWGTGSCVTGSRAFVQLERCELGASRPHTSVTGVRCTGDGLIVARDCLFTGEGGAVQSARDAYLERCVVEADRRNGVDGTQQGSLVLVDCLIESQASGVSNVGRGVLEGVVFVGRAASGLGAHVAWCAEHVRASGPSGDLLTSGGMARCPLDRTRR